MATFLTADWHLGEPRERLELLGRPFASTEEMGAALLAEHNRLVAPEDELIVVGDVAVSSDWLPAVTHFNGKKTLIRGNQDRRFADEDLAPYFERVVAEGDGVELAVGSLALYATHYPTRGREDRFNLVGHVHSSWQVQLNCLNVGVDVHHFRPVPLEKARFYFEAIDAYYDEDVWVAYRRLNRRFRRWPRRRGKPGSYLQTR